MKIIKKRLDVLLHERDLATSRAKAQGMIMAGEVFVNGNKADKVGTSYPEDCEILVKARPQYVSRGGEKLAAALHDFAYDPAGQVVADVGASTGGFTDCLLQHGAKKIYAIDVGYGQIASKLRESEAVVVIERTNARYIEALPEVLDLVVIDASFISLRLLLPVVKNWLTPMGTVIALVKPQFEAGRDDVGKGGVVRNREVHRRVILDVIAAAQELGFHFVNLTISPIKGPAGNIEFLLQVSRLSPTHEPEEITQYIANFFEHLDLSIIS